MSCGITSVLNDLTVDLSTSFISRTPQNGAACLPMGPKIKYVNLPTVQLGNGICVRVRDCFPVVVLLFASAMGGR